MQAILTQLKEIRLISFEREKENGKLELSKKIFQGKQLQNQLEK